MLYWQTLLSYLKDEKSRRDLADYLRAIVIMAAVMAILRIMLDLIL